jgi:uncharacterized phage protein (TIGR02218 family)
MKTASGSLIALLNTMGVFLMADLWTITLRDATVLRWTNVDTNITMAGSTWTASTDQGGQPLIKRGPLRCVRGLEVDVLDVTLLTGGTVQLSGIRLPLAAHNGAFDGARVKVERVVMPTWGDTSAGSLVLFEGEVAGVDPATAMTVLHVKSDLERHNIQMPHTLFMPGCANAFGDAGCGKNLAALTATGTAGAGTNASQVTGVAGADGYYNLGVITMTSGPAAGSRRSVKSFTGGVVVPAVPFPVAPAPGDTFSIYPGCARTYAACQGWANTNRFRGCPYVPVPETTR